MVSDQSISARGRIFVSYRREDTQHVAGRLADRVAERFGAAAVFMDVDAIEPGVDFVDAVERAIQGCDAFLALIGREWLTATDKRGNRRLDDADDFVVVEVSAALRRNIRVIPVLVDGAVMPARDDLPPGLQPLVRRHAVRLDHETFRADISRLLDALEHALAAGTPEPDGGDDGQSSAPEPTSPGPRGASERSQSSARWIAARILTKSQVSYGELRLDLDRVEWAPLEPTDRWTSLSNTSAGRLVVPLDRIRAVRASGKAKLEIDTDDVTHKFEIEPPEGGMMRLRVLASQTDRRDVVRQLDGTT